MKPKFRVINNDGKYAIEYLHVTKRFLLPDKKEWKPFIHYLGQPNNLFWHRSLESLKLNLLWELKII
jgi:hypothetical protein